MANLTNLKFFIVDVFAEEKYAGNQLAVFVDAEHLTTAQMQRIAQEINYSETTFILAAQPRHGGYDVRIFTPAQELPFAGHPTLGTAYILQQQVIQQPVATVTLNLAVGQIPVSLRYLDAIPRSTQNPDLDRSLDLDAPALDRLWMRQNPPTFGEVLAVEDMAPILGLAVAECDRRFPIQAVSTGVPFIIVPVVSLAALQRIKINVDQLFARVASLQAKQILVFCPETRDPANHLSVRVFAHALGIPEDPATGSANGCLAGYLAEYGYFGPNPVDVRVEQGYEIGRPSLLGLQAAKHADEIAVSVGGRVILVARGEFV
jgi:trans-2,3-dihydro-3-hydroxyanthranilate isomerase